MQYRHFGSTGVRVSILGYGAMRLPTRTGGKVDLDRAVPLLRRGIDLGINYIDSAHMYIRGTSEVAVGVAIKSYERESLYLATKIQIGSSYASDAVSWLRKLDESLRRLDTPYIDFIYFHDFRWQKFQDYVAGRGKIMEAARRVQAQGLVRHICFSSHDSVTNVIKLIDTGEFEGLLLQYNYLDRHNTPAIARAAEKGMGVAIMGPLAGGRLVRRGAGGSGKERGPREVKPAQLGLRFVWSNPYVSVALSGMNALDQIEENAATADRPEMSDAELAQVQPLVERSKSLADLYCTGCGYCMPCPNGVDIPGNFEIYNQGKMFDQLDRARQAYDASIAEKARASACMQCRECEEKCPQNIRISEWMPRVHAVLGEGESYP